MEKKIPRKFHGTKFFESHLKNSEPVKRVMVENECHGVELIRGILHNAPTLVCRWLPAGAGKLLFDRPMHIIVKATQTRPGLRIWGKVLPASIGHCAHLWKYLSVE